MIENSCVGEMLLNTRMMIIYFVDAPCRLIFRDTGFELKMESETRIDLEFTTCLNKENDDGWQKYNSAVGEVEKARLVMEVMDSRVVWSGRQLWLQ